MKRLSSGIIALMIWTAVYLLQPLQIQCLAADFERISVEELKSLLDSQADVVVVDSRSKQSYDTEHIPGAISIPDAEIETRHQELPRDKTIILY